jgi:hypothetical protein
MEHEGKARRRLVLPLLVFGAVLVAVVYGVVTAWPLLRVASLSGTKAVLLAITDALRAPVPAAALWPVRAVLEPVFLGSGGAWLALMPWAAAILMLHYLWVVRLDKAFEEAALEATQHRAERLRRVRSSQLGNSRSRKGKLAKVPSLALRLARVADGAIDGGLVSPDSRDWDLAAADLVLREAGGLVSGLDGMPLAYNRPRPVHATLVAAPHAFHARLLGAATALREPFASRV